MPPSNVIRSFTILLAIAIVIIGPHVRGFTIDRTDKGTLSKHAHSADLSSDESFQLQVKDDQGQHNDINNKDDYSIKTLNGMRIDISQNNLNVEHKQISTDIRTTTENNKIPTISSDTVEVFDSVEDVTEFKSIKSNAVLSTKPLETEKKVTTLNKNMDSLAKTSEDTTIIPEFSTNIDQIYVETESTKDQPIHKDSISISVPEDKTIESTIDMSDITPKYIDTSTFTTTIESEDDINKDVYSSTDVSSTSETLVTSTPNEHAVKTTDAYSTYLRAGMETTTDFNTNLSDPLWKKYTTIVRKHVTSLENTHQTSKPGEETTKGETSNSRVNFEHSLNVTPILEESRLKLLSNTNEPVFYSEMITDESEKSTVTIKSIMVTANTVENSETKGGGIIQSKRAGYLDYSDKMSTTVAIATSTDKNNMESDTTVNEVQTTETEAPDLNIVTISGAQSQLVEDAIKEELMKEEALNNHQDNIGRHRDEKTENEGVKSLDETAILETTLTGSPVIGGDDSLSVQPINQERAKTTLYTYSPNYKPMKKIDVQPAKTFLRDPDDNSWRNESISSLGIVFKPKNSSISFKEVLKNKTQTELNNLLIQDKDAKANVPDLRLRLEKIAEVRKTKKKNMNKDGEEVYTDYEEDKSSEGIGAPISPSISSGLGSAEVAKVTTSTPAITPRDLEEVTSPMSTWKTQEATKTKISKDIFKSLGLDSLDFLTTEKPKKIFNIAEYDDTTDEYDADYVTMSKLDLKKFKVPSSTTLTPKEMHHIEPLLNKPMTSYFPERKPTVQYFPPRKHQKVNFNNVDQNFERKINLFNDRAKSEPQPPFVTLAPLPIATEEPGSETKPNIPPDMRPYMSPDQTEEIRPDMKQDFRLVNPPNAELDIVHSMPNMRPTVKPTDFTGYTPRDLNKNYYLANAPVIHEGSLNRGSYVIRHYKDLLNAAAIKSADDERRDNVPLTESPRGVSGTATVSTTPKSVDYDYDAHFHKEVLNRFVDNFNQNSERFKVDFPILYNSSVMHRPADGHGRVGASSRAFLKRLYNNEGTATKSNTPSKKPCEPHCDVTVELSPAYELHYYVPEQEEMEPGSPTPLTPPYRYAL